jgi:hypothetical protein
MKYSNGLDKIYILMRQSHPTIRTLENWANAEDISVTYMAKRACMYVCFEGVAAIALLELSLKWGKYRKSAKTVKSVCKHRQSDENSTVAETTALFVSNNPGKIRYTS